MQPERPSKKQRELLSFIDSFIKGHGYGPSYREIMRALDYKSVSTVAIHIDNLIKKGHVRKKTRSARSLEVTAPISSNSVAPREQAVASEQSKWLVDLINARFESVGNKPSTKSVDGLYVLVGALHVLGLQEAHVAARSRLIALEKELKS